MGSSGGNPQPVTQQTTQTKDPWSVAQPYLQSTMGSAQSLYATDQGYRPWTGPTQAPLNTDITTSLANMRNTLTPDAARGGSEGVLAARSAGLNSLNNQGLSPELRSLYQQAQGDQNPYLESIIRQQVGGANAAASGMGRYGSGAHDAAITQAISPTLAQDYARRQQQMQDILTGGQQRMGQWAQVMPGLDEARLAPAQGLMTIGQYQQERSQDALNDQIKLYNQQQAYQWEQLARYNAIVGGAGALGGTTAGTTTTPINSPSTLQKLLGGATAGAGLGGSFGGLPGAGIGALGGGLLGLL